MTTSIIILSLFFIAFKTAKVLRIGFFLLGLATLITIGVHSILSLMSRLNYLAMPMVMSGMVIQIFIGSVIMILGTYYIHKEIKGVTEKE